MRHIKLILPRYDHDCDHCRFVGHLGNVDCYTCGDSVIIRYSDDSPDYASLPRSLAVRDEDYRQVLRMEADIIKNGWFEA